MSRRRTASFLPLGAGPSRPAPEYPEYPQLLADARAALAADGGFVDPRKMYAVERLPRGWEWRVCVLGHDSERSAVDMHLLLLAHKRDLCPPIPQWLADQRAEAAARDEEKKHARQARDAAVLTGPSLFERPLRKPHFATCPEAEQWRRR